MPPTPGNSAISASGNLTVLTLLAIDAVGIVVLFNLNHWLITGDVSSNLLLTWKLALILFVSFLYYYLMDLYRFDSPLSQLGMLERSFIATLLIGVSVALLVYITGPSFIGGFVGRGVLAASLLSFWLWSLGFRYLANIWFAEQRSSIHWLVIVDGNPEHFLKDFRTSFERETLLLLQAPGSDIALPLAANTRLAGDWDDLESVLQTQPVHGIIVTSIEQVPDDLVEKLMPLRINGIRVYRLSDFYEQHLARLPIFQLSQQWLTTAHGFDLIHNPIGLRFKRYIDVLIAIAGLTLGLPLLLTVAALVFVTSGWPILYQQLRTGENNRPFTCYKFRTMVRGAEADGAQFATEDDPRLTPLGKTLRKFRLDELPQLWNVLAGDMSLIGPRPERPEFVENLASSIPYYNLRHLVKPGITGWAQVMHGYGDSEDDAAVKLQYDLFYIKNYSLLLDISILIKSIKVILFGTGR